MLNLIKSVAKGEKKHIGISSMDRLLDNKDFNYLSYFRDFTFLNFKAEDMIHIKNLFSRDFEFLVKQGITNYSVSLIVEKNDN